MKTNISVKDYGNHLFYKSMVNTRFLKHYKINMKVKDFLEWLKTQNYKVVAVGGRDENQRLHYKHIKVWDINEILSKLKKV